MPHFSNTDENTCLPFVASAKKGSLDAMMNGGECEACQ
jgi:hypothetical protein